MRLGRNICHVSTVTYCKAKRGAGLKWITFLSVIKSNIMHFDRQQI